MLLQATSPVRLPGTLDRALAEFALHRRGLPRRASSRRRRSCGGPATRRGRTTPSTPVRVARTSPPRRLRYRETGSLYVTKRWVYDDLDNRLGGRIGLFVMDEVEGTDVDTELDLAVAEQQLRGL